MIRAIIIDDELNCIKTFQNDIKMFCPDIEVIDTCQSAKESLLSIKRNKPGLIFLDIEMPWMNGFEMLELIDKEINFQIIFTTAYDQFAIRAFKVSAIDYLLKPVDSDDLIHAIEKVKKAMQEKQGGNNITNLLQNTKAPAEHQKIAIPSREGYDFIPVGEIIYCKANGAYTEIILENNKKILLSKSLGETEEMLPAELFERIHHSILVNIHHINQYKKTTGSFLVMNNGDELNVSKSKKEQLLIRLGVR